jgi:hypothetical protein
MTDCIHCGEPILPGDRIPVTSTRAQHFECFFRAIIGGVRHQQGLCSCCCPGSGLDPDDPTLSKRNQARAAVAYYRKHTAP